MVGSSQANLFASISAGICALWGPLHGGANEEVLEMLQPIQDDGGERKKFVDMAKDKDSGFRLMGFGHRVYKNYDPRAKIIKVAADKVLSKLRQSRIRCSTSPRRWKRRRCQDTYFVERKLYPNVDFYSGIIYRALGIPTNMFTVMFAIGRTAGLDRALERDDGRSDDEDLPPAADLHGPAADPLRAGRAAQVTGRAGGVARPAS